MLDNLFPKVVYEGSSEFNKDIRVIKVGKTTKLIVDGIVQSFNNDSGFAKRKVWGQVVKIIAKEKPDVQRILILGMGGGTMIHMLNRAFSDLDITSVEIDQVIVDLAYKYFGMDQTNIKVIVADALDVISDPLKYGLQSDFDCIVVDTCVGGDHPAETSSAEFLNNLFELLVDGAGLVVFNRIIPKERPNEAEEFRNALEPYVNKVGTKIIKYPTIADNHIFYGNKSGQSG